MPPKVLIIDDNLDHIKLTRRVLIKQEYKVFAATDAEMGLQMATEHHPDVILLDLNLPDADGQTLLGKMRRVPELAPVPIIAVTAWPAGTDPKTIKTLGFDGYMSKPINFSALGDQIAAYLSSGGNSKS